MVVGVSQGSEKCERIQLEPLKGLKHTQIPDISRYKRNLFCLFELCRGKWEWKI